MYRTRIVPGGGCPSEARLATLRPQAVAMLAALREAPVSSVAARINMGIMQPATRIHELRELGFNIRSECTKTYDNHGRRHTCAIYILEE